MKWGLEMGLLLRQMNKEHSSSLGNGMPCRARKHAQSVGVISNSADTSIDEPISILLKIALNSTGGTCLFICLLKQI
jgi:hypothetical protein